MTTHLVSDAVPATPAAGIDSPEFLARLRDGDADAFTALVRATSGRLLAVARRMLGNEADARDALQDGLLAAHRSLASFRGTARLSTWLHRIVVNAALMKLRSRRRRPEESIDALLPQFDAQGRRVGADLAAAPDAERAFEHRQTLAAIRRAAERLPLAYREVFVLRDVEDLDTAEVAALLGVSDGVVKIRLHRARQALRSLIDQELAVRSPAPGIRSGLRAGSRCRVQRRPPSRMGDFGMLRA
jgi:RNA polymerase sigma-70 factor (ECF subfamily)